MTAPNEQRSFTQALALAAVLLLACGATQAQRPFREYPSFEGADADAPLPPDYQIPAELVIGRLMYPSAGRGFFGGANYKRGGTGWTDDYPRGDRIFVQMLRRFTRTEVRGVEQPVDVDDADDMDYWPFMLVGLAQSWRLTDEEAANLREYLLRGGFLFCDSFFGSNNWQVFEESLKRVFPDRPIVDVSDDHPIFHVVFDLPQMTRAQIPNWNSLARGGPGYLGYDGRPPRWRGVMGDDGRLLVLIAYNNDVMDGWQWADDPRYPAEEANLALRLGVNVAMYAMTH
ncbi:MAG TPA: DUF4159 domain-containing protein [Gammaproteobacteria bacterium]|nr:DUF4159 domain-containing protein [Gammaproteobacteria bacterium]